MRNFLQPWLGVVVGAAGVGGAGATETTGFGGGFIVRSDSVDFI